MAVANFTDLSAHVNHQVQVVQYGGDEPTNAAIECVECSEVLLDFDASVPQSDASVSLYVSWSAGRRGAGSMDCRHCGEKIHQHGLDPEGGWFDGDGLDAGPGLPLGGEGSQPQRGLHHLTTWHTHEPASEIGPTLGPFEYVELTYNTVRISPDGDTLAHWDPNRSDWILSDLAGDYAGEAYSDATIAPGAPKELPTTTTKEG